MLGIALAVLGCLAFSITCIGTVGSVSSAATRRRQEIGIRMALGAGRRGMLLLLLKQMRWPLGAGVAVGLAAAIPTGRVMFVAAILPVTPFDPPILVLVGGFVLLTAVAAALWPAS